MSRAALNPNPIRIARTQLGLTLKELAEKAEVHYQAVYLNECGVYENVLPSLVRFFVSNGFSMDALVQDYRQFQKNLRMEFAGRWDLQSPMVLGSADFCCPPVVHFRKRFDLSRTAFAKAICVQPAVLYKLEVGRASRLPDQLVDALKEMGMAQDLIMELNDRTEGYFVYKQTEH